MLDWAKSDGRSARKLFYDYIEKDFSANDAFIIAALVISPFPHRHGELKELGEEYMKKLREVGGCTK